MTNWVGSKEEAFDGCLVILNIGQDNIGSLPDEYRQSLVSWIAEAHAAGCVVLYVFDSETGPFSIPEEFDNIEGMDYIRMMFSTCGRKDCDFSLLPDQRMEEFKKMGEALHGAFKFAHDLKICGWCKISGSKVLLPLTVIP